eukprot:GILJ01008482.1.p1 GENE.GILJ01008482.1~~GILJ01008482.1.p1  ORF type:complete len:504 (+),score=71.70 GILJ01008482.1:45-1556(+)
MGLMSRMVVGELAFLCVALLCSHAFADKPAISVGLSYLDIVEDQRYGLIEKGDVNGAWAPFSMKTCGARPAVSSPGTKNVTFYIQNVGSVPVAFAPVTAKTAESGSVLAPSVDGNSSTSFMINPQEIHNLTLFYNCLSGPSRSWDTIILSLKAGDSEPMELFWMKFCEDSSSFDWSMIITFVLATVVVAFGALQTQALPSSDGQPEEVAEVQTHHGVLFVVIGSCALVVLFFLLKYVSILLTIMISFSSCMALLVFLLLIGERIVPKSWNCDKEINIPYLGPAPVLAIFLFFVSAGIVVAWALTKNWLLNNLLGVCLCLLFMRYFQMSSIKVAACLLILAFFYDIFWVFGSSHVFGDNVMVAVASSVDLPLKLELPHVGDAPPFACSMIGLGDLVLPGLLICFARRFDQFKKVNVYFPIDLIAYVVGLAICGIILGVTGAAQPALLYLVPCCLGAVVILGVSRKELKDLWNGISAPSEHEVHGDENQGLVNHHVPSSSQYSNV